MTNPNQDNSVVLPHQTNRTFLMDAGCETTLIFLDGIELPYFASFTLHDTPAGVSALKRYFRTHLGTAIDHNNGYILETATWRASADWGALLGYDAEALSDVNIRAVGLIRDVLAEAGPLDIPVVLSGCIGPRGDGYVVGQEMTADEAFLYHRPQAEALARGGVQMITGLTMTYAREAIGVVRAAHSVKRPSVISFTVETDGQLPTGQSMEAFITEVDAATDGGAAYYMINCAHPDHFRDALRQGGAWLKRIRGVRANASRMSHAELDESPVLDDGDPRETGRDYADLLRMLPHLNVFGGCCGTDSRHICAIADSIRHEALEAAQ